MIYLQRHALHFFMFLALFTASLASASTSESEKESHYLAEKMGVPQRYTQNDLLSLISLPVYQTSALVYNRYNGIEFDDQMASLPFAVLLTDDDVGKVEHFYQQRLAGFTRYRYNDSVLFFQDSDANLSGFPLSAMHSVYVEIHAYPLGSEMGTMIKISYAKKLR